MNNSFEEQIRIGAFFLSGFDLFAIFEPSNSVVAHLHQNEVKVNKPTKLSTSFGSHADPASVD